MSRATRLSLNRVTVTRSSVAEVIVLAEQEDIPAIGLWRRDIPDAATRAELASRVGDAGLRISSLCFAGHLTRTGATDRRAAVDDTRRAIDEAASVGAPALVVVPGGLEAGNRDARAAVGWLGESLSVLEPHAASAQVVLALEPMHPMFFAQFGILPTLASALDVAEQFSPSIGVLVDTFHTWWDPHLVESIERAGRGARIAAVQLDDFVTPLAPDPVESRGHLGDGHIEWEPIVTALEAAGYNGDYEVEIFSRTVWAADAASTARRVRADHERLIEPLLRDPR